ncbi:hypothetical protein [Acidisoma silvae]|uniref:hypothetical protein n=1 Tax=Acidisoma silvae TaxID=2802396 RepID=UPI001D0B8F43|nr:hypothetical protein [Acidisoma silvae]
MNVVVPESAPTTVLELPAAVTVSFGAVKMAVLLVVVMALLPVVVSATASAPEIVIAEFVLVRTAEPLTVAAPDVVSGRTVMLVVELK